jgi:hypothetical protein
MERNMKELFLLEHMKLWRSLLVKLSVLICFFFVVIIGLFLSFQWTAFGSTNGTSLAFSNHFDGYEMIQNRREYGKAFGGVLTDESFQQMVHEYQLAEASGDMVVQEQTDTDSINSWLQILYPELLDTGSYQTMISYVDPEQLTDFYDRREKAVLQLLDHNRTDSDKEFLLRMEQEISEPFRYQLTEGWRLILNSAISDMGMIMAIFLAIVLSSLFAGEWQYRTSPLVLTTRNGWRQIACAKILVGLAFAVELFTLLFAGNLALQLIYMGTDGWDMPIQTIRILAIAPFQMLQAEIYEYTFVFLCAIGYGCIVMCISSFAKSNVTALICSLAVIFVPLAIMGNLPLTVQKLLQMIPFVGSGQDIFGTKIYHFIGMQIWSPWVLLIAPIMMGIACLPAAVRRWARQMKA